MFAFVTRDGDARCFVMLAFAAAAHAWRPPLEGDRSARTADDGGDGMGGQNHRTRDVVFQCLVQYKRDHDGLTPSLKELAELCGLHMSTVKYHLMQLEIDGRIRILGRRAIEVVGGVWNLPPR
jgi:hypothetical protein